MKRFLKLYILMLFSVTANHIFAQRVEWAFHVDSVSSEYSPDRHAAKEVLGVPNVDRRGRNSIYAWAVEPNVLDKEGVEVAFIQVSFKKVSDATQLAVFESFNPGAIALIEIKDEKNNWKTVYVDSLVIARTGFGTFVTSEKEYDREREFDNNQENYLYTV